MVNLLNIFQMSSPEEWLVCGLCSAKVFVHKSDADNHPYDVDDEDYNDGAYDCDHADDDDGDYDCDDAD